MEKRLFTIEALRPIRDGMTISRNLQMNSENEISFFSLGKDTDIGQESYDTAAIYIGGKGTAEFILGENEQRKYVSKNDLLIVPERTLCGAIANEGVIYTEIITKKEIHMNNLVKAGETIALKELISYEEGSIANLDIVHNDTMKFVLMAFDEGTGLTSHRAPGNAIITALEGQAVIGYEGVDYELNEGESFRFDKNGLHSVTAKGQFKMSLLLVLSE